LLIYQWEKKERRNKREKVAIKDEYQGKGEGNNRRWMSERNHG
jgi:hypothetical protein